jgi:putative flippase GtrA
VFTIINFFAELPAKLFEWLIPLLTILYYIGLILLVLWSVLLTVRALWERYEWSAVITAVLMVIVAYLWENQFSVFINRRSPAHP